MLRFLPAFCLAVTLAVPASAQTFRAENRVIVTPGASSFAVPNGAGMGARGMWCAAAEYARSVLGAGGTQRLYVAVDTSARGPARFTIDPAGLTPSRVTLVGGSVRVPGANVSVDHAYSFCADDKLIRR